MPTLTCHIQVGGSGSANENHNTNKKYRTETLGYADNGLIVLENKPLPEEFNEIYRDAIEDYNRKVCEAGRPGRMKSLDYFGELRESKQNIETNHEILVTVGNYYTTGSKTADEQIRKDAVEMLARWYTGFIRENPELHVYCAAIHCDEVGAPHLHVDFIPAAAGKEKGIGLSPSLDRALINKGISKAGGYSQLLKRWTDKEKERMYEIIKDKGYEVDRGTGLSRQKTLTVEEYKTLREESTVLAEKYQKLLTDEIAPFMELGGQKVGNPAFVEMSMKLITECFRQINDKDEVITLLKEFDEKEKEKKKAWKKIYDLEKQLKEEVKELREASSSHDHLQPARNALIQRKLCLLEQIADYKKDVNVGQYMLFDSMHTSDKLMDERAYVMNMLYEKYPEAYRDAKSMLEEYEPNTDFISFEEPAVDIQPDGVIDTADLLNSDVPEFSEEPEGPDYEEPELYEDEDREL